MKTVKVKRNWLSESDLRLDASYHLSEGVNTKRIIDKLCPFPKVSLKDESLELFKGNIHKRVYVTNPDNGLMFYTASDMFKSDIDSGKYLSKKYSPYLKELELKKDWILITRSGTLGNVVYTTSDYEGKIGTDDLVRIKPRENKVKKGFLYAFLSSKFGYGLITQSSYGGVVKHIEPHHIQNIQIPILPEKKQDEINQLIFSATELRVEANGLLKKAQDIILDSVGFKKRGLSKRISINNINESHQKRLEAQCFVSEGHEIISHIKKSDFKYLKGVSEPIFRPGIFKRHYVEYGIDFLGGADIGRTIPKSDKKLSSAKTKHLQSLKIKENWILVTCGGTIGNCALVNNYTDGKSASQHILRVITNGIPNGYLYAFLSSSIGLKAIQSFSYGSVIPQIEPHHLGLLPIPILPDTIMKDVNDMVMRHKNCIASSIKNELLAIDLVEKEIESWQK